MHRDAPPPLGLVLDFGAVVTKSFFELTEFATRAFGLPAGSCPWRGPFAPETDDLWRAMLRDELTEREYWKRRATEIGALAQRSLDTHGLMMATYGAAGAEAFRPEIDLLVREARAGGLKVGILTNELELFHGRPWMDTVPLLAHVDALVDATHTGILKPDPRAYRAISDALGMPPDRLLFTDDQPRNVSGASRTGMRAVHFEIRDVEQSIAQIRLELGLTEPNDDEVVHVHS